MIRNTFVGNMNVSAIQAVVILFLMISCHAPKKMISQKSTEKAITDTNKSQAAVTPFPYNFKRQDWNTFMSKLDIQYESTDYPLPVSSFSGQLRMVYGQSIWMSVSVPLIGEIGRALITRDSIIVLNKYQRCYFKEPYQFINRFISIPVSLEKLQDLLTGNPILSTQNTINDTNGLILSSKLEDSLLLQNVWASIIDLWVSRSGFVDKSTGRDLDIRFQNRNSENGYFFPSQIVLSIQKPSAAQAHIGLNSIQINQSFQSELKIPNGYSACKK